MIYPNNFEQKIGFSQIREILKTYCLSNLGKELVDDMSFSDKYNWIHTQLVQTKEFVKILQEEENFPSQYFFDIREPLKRIKIEGMYLDEQELFDLRRSLDTIFSIVSFFNNKKDDDGNSNYPSVMSLVEGVITFPDFVKRIDSIIDKYGKIKDGASPELSRIRRELFATTSGISRSLNSILRTAQSEGYVDKDATPTMRDGRLVIPISPALKRKIKGIVHDESASGKTVFIEPAEVVEANNKIRELESAERREIIRILTEFSDKVRPHIEDILLSYKFLAQIDFIRAKASFSIESDACMPYLENIPMINWKKAIHVLLKKSLDKSGKKVVPLDIELNSKQRILIISGPNAGGKSVCLKTVGLLQYMLQCGIHIPVDENSTSGVFSHIFIDIGDEQSIEDDLSTYSSHLTNMKMMIKHSDDKSLILIDEFGGGTEPQIGGAIAESVLKRFNEKRALGVITTHYQNLKHFAEDNEGVVNGAMLYDRHMMQALFQLQIGNPGSSFAIEIARKIGLPEEVISDATEIVGINYINADKYLQDIVRDKRYWENKRQSIRLKEKKMEEVIETYSNEIESLKKLKKEEIKQAKEQANNILKEANAKVENTIRLIKEAQAEKEKTKKARAELSRFKSEVIDSDNDDSDIKTLRKGSKKDKNKFATDNKKVANSIIKKPTPISVGDHVKIKGQTAVGEVTEIKGSNATISFGFVNTRIKIDKLERTKQPADSGISKKSSFVTSQTTDKIYEAKLNFKQDIDVRGMRGDEAIQTVTYFIDDAILVGMSRVRILHGTGTGALRKMIREYLSTVSGVKHFADEHIDFGGAGITVVDLE